MPRTFVHSERVRFGDLDAMRHLNNVEFLRFFETARIAFVRSRCPSTRRRTPREGFGLIFAEARINYRFPVQFDEVLDTACWIGEVRRSSFQVMFRMTVGERLAAEGYSWLVGFDYTTQAAMPLPDRLREILDAALA